MNSRPSAAVAATNVCPPSSNTVGEETKCAPGSVNESLTRSVFDSSAITESAVDDRPSPVATYSVPSVPNAGPVMDAPSERHDETVLSSPDQSIAHRASGAPPQPLEVTAYITPSA